MAAAAKGHEQALETAQKSIDEIIVKLLPAHASELGAAVNGALRERSAPGWMSDKLKVIS